jgi:16S rRNA (uracil1498-N3)-methyltransferase
MQNFKHEFAVYYDKLSLHLQAIIPGLPLKIEDEAIYHRLHTVLRLEEGDHCVLFDRNEHASGVIVGFRGKRIVMLTVESHNKNPQLSPLMSVYLPVLKREALETALYGLTEVGVQEIFLVHTQKSRRDYGSVDELERLERITIAAAEQSKNFIVPKLHAAISLETLVSNSSLKNRYSLYFDPQGMPTYECMQIIHQNSPSQISMMVGPEGDLTEEEKKILTAAGFIFCALTPTVLRAAQAICLGAGMMRAVFSTPSAVFK